MFRSEVRRSLEKIKVQSHEKEEIENIRNILKSISVKKLKPENKDAMVKYLDFMSELMKNCYINANIDDCKVDYTKIIQNLKSENENSCFFKNKTKIFRSKKFEYKRIEEIFEKRKKK